MNLDLAGVSQQFEEKPRVHVFSGSRKAHDYDFEDMPNPEDLGIKAKRIFEDSTFKRLTRPSGFHSPSPWAARSS